LKLADRHCARAIDYWEEGRPNKAGEILTWEQMQAVALAVCEKLVSEGRQFDGEPEPPLSPEDALAGKAVALDWLATNPIEPGAVYEAGLGVGIHTETRVWLAVPYDHEGAYLKTAIDSHRIEEDEDGQTVLDIRDYKSNWNANADELQTIQRKLQTLICLAHYPDVDVIRREVVNLRTRMMYSDELYLAFPETQEQLEEWRVDIAAMVEALEQKPRTANPGARCTACPYLGQCEDAQEWLETVSGSASKEDLATAYCIASAEMYRLRDLLKAATANGSVETEDAVVGSQRQEKQQLKADAYAEMLEAWLPKYDDTGYKTEESAAAYHDGRTKVVFSVRGLLHAMKPSKGSAEAVLRILMPDRADVADRKALLEEWTEPVGQARFLITRK
jgi:hypothetical protein